MKNSLFQFPVVIFPLHYSPFSKNNKSQTHTHKKRRLTFERRNDNNNQEKGIYDEEIQEKQKTSKKVVYSESLLSVVVNSTSEVIQILVGDADLVDDFLTPDMEVRDVGERLFEELHYIICEAFEITLVVLEEIKLCSLGDEVSICIAVLESTKEIQHAGECSNKEGSFCITSVETI